MQAVLKSKVDEYFRLRDEVAKLLYNDIVSVDINDVERWKALKLELSNTMQEVQRLRAEIDKMDRKVEKSKPVWIIIYYPEHFPRCLGPYETEEDAREDVRKFGKKGADFTVVQTHLPEDDTELRETFDYK
jgi:hypothetical protein